MRRGNKIQIRIGEVSVYEREKIVTLQQHEY